MQLAGTIRDSERGSSPSARHIDDHNSWIQGLYSDYNQRVSLASALDLERQEQQSSSGDVHSEINEEVDTAAWDHAEEVGLPAHFDRALEFCDEFQEETVYRCLSLEQPSGYDVSNEVLDDTDFPIGIGKANNVLQQSEAEVEASWLCAMPPLIRRQNAFDRVV